MYWIFMLNFINNRRLHEIEKEPVIGSFFVKWYWFI